MWVTEKIVVVKGGAKSMVYRIKNWIHIPVVSFISSVTITKKFNIPDFFVGQVETWLCDLRGKVFNFSPLSMLLAEFVIYGLYYIKLHFFFTHFIELLS